VYAGRERTRVEQDRLDRLFSERVEPYLDSGQGACHLARADISGLVVEALRHFDGTRYRLFAWCVMPNHVHVVVRPAPGQGLAGILHSWKSFTAKQANKILKTRGGGFWQREYYDHLVRDEQDLERIVQSVMDNPARAGLEGWKWV
jgi:REP element-mobilizing transposase RayT